jgi:hypothetical protein
MPLLRQGPGLVRGAVAVGGATAVSGRVRRRQQQKWAAQDQAAYEEQAVAAPPPQQAAPAAPDYTAELEKLAKLRDEGVISAEDFEAKKQQLLGI